MNEKETLRRIREIMFTENILGEEKITLIYLALRDQALETSSQEFPLTPEECFSPEQVIETFEEEFHPVSEEKTVDFGSSIDSMLFSGIVADKSTSSILEEEELKLVAEVDLTSDNAETLINEIKKEAFSEAPEMTAEEFNETSKDVLVEEPEPTEEEIAVDMKEMITEMKDYSNLHKREFEDLSKLQLSAELIISPKDLMKMNSLINENNNLLTGIEISTDQAEIGEDATMWAENSQEIFIIHREYFRIGDKGVKKTLVQGVFEAFNSFSVENKIDLMKQYSEFLGEKEEEIVKTDSGVPLPKSFSTTGPGSVPLVGEDNDEGNSSASTGTGPATAKTQKEIDEENSFVTRMEDLENLLTGDFEIQDEEIPTFEKIEQIAKEHGELAAKEYVASLSQEQREQLARERVAQMNLKQATESSEMTKETQETEQPEIEVAE